MASKTGSSLGICRTSFDLWILVQYGIWIFWVDVYHGSERKPQNEPCLAVDVRYRRCWIKPARADHNNAMTYAAMFVGTTVFMPVFESYGFAAVGVLSAACIAPALLSAIRRGYRVSKTVGVRSG